MDFMLSQSAMFISAESHKARCSQDHTPRYCSVQHRRSACADRGKRRRNCRQGSVFASACHQTLLPRDRHRIKTGSGSCASGGKNPRGAEAPKPLRVLKTQLGVEVRIYDEGDGRTYPQQLVYAHCIGRLPTGIVFESTKPRGNPPMELKINQRAIVPGMESGLMALSLGARADIFVPAEFGYGAHGVPSENGFVIPPNTDLLFEVEIEEVDGKKVDKPIPPKPRVPAPARLSTGLFLHPFWLSRVQRPAPAREYIAYCKFFARSGYSSDAIVKLLTQLQGARPIPRLTYDEVKATGWDGTKGANVISDFTRGWEGREKFSFDWFREGPLADERQLVKWLGPVFCKAETLHDIPIWEVSVGEYVDYIDALDSVDPDCEEQHANMCPRIYLNGWPVFLQKPWMRKYVENPPFVKECTRELLEDYEHLVNAVAPVKMTEAQAAQAQKEREEKIEESDWEYTKLFICPKGAITRLHYDNGGAHVWLTQLRGRKLFICYPPEDTPNLHAFSGDEGLPNHSWIDPLHEKVYEKWPDYAKVKPYVAVVEEGEALIAPQAWWHYTVSLDASVTVMRNFYCQNNMHEYDKRRDTRLVDVFTDEMLMRSAKFKGQPREVAHKVSEEMVAKIRIKIREMKKQGIDPTTRQPIASSRKSPPCAI